MKIKTNKQFTLPQLIEWAFENDVTGSIYSDDRVEAKKIRFEVGVITLMHGDMHKDDIFTVEEEIEITEDTWFEHMIEITEGDLHITWQNTKIDWEKDGESKEFHAYIDGEFKCIWRDGKLME